MYELGLIARPVVGYVIVKTYQILTLQNVLLPILKKTCVGERV